MTIVDRTHASQVVTNKGKNFKFDSSECMIHYVLEKSDEQNLLHILSANYLNPGNMIDATSATFIISEEIPSPMGAFLSAIESKNEAENLQKEFGGNLYSWEEVKVEIGSQEKYFH